MRLNQWANVVRWEMRPRIFLRTSEFLWQEGHTAHATSGDASAFARQIHLDVYRDFLQSMLAIPVLVGVKTDREKFAGAVTTMTCEAMMGDGKALQMATSHELGQNFAKVFNINYTDSSGRSQKCWTTSWGSSTRMIGGLIMAHGDDHGLRIPPRVAPVQVVVIAVKDDDRTVSAASALTDSLVSAGVRARLDVRTDQGFGRRATEWELKGVPLRVEVGPRDLERGEYTVVRRDTRQKLAVVGDSAVTTVRDLLDVIHSEMFAAAGDRLVQRTSDVGTVAEAVDVSATGFARIPWKVLGEHGERELNAHAITVRCLQTIDGTLPDGETPREELMAIVGRSY
ncbi:proline--tRNA ligase [Rhodococcus pyridinivorans]|uniref:His/Gly/Thr/Pro-type tRNA ligase C-terminal domain-containing protein n=1 Tax=Rhodococcus pyridinivorans TaxID=103816 RepID=UPI001E49652F|nr:His/Gly/Thr/Pro-type tRNA ligase C-terminal domain-containing protein [Rhodococcus pyridinivorans]MCD5418019.1 proline--tRNA ligase [Rhodococcus pyridinivorans]